MRTRHDGRHRTGRIARTRSRETEPRDAVDVELPEQASQSVTGEPLTERALRELDPEVLRAGVDASAEETPAHDTPPEDTPSRSGAYRAGRRALMLGCWSVFGFAVVLVLSVTVPNLFGLRDLTVLSGSMEPTIHTGDVVVERQISPLDVRLGDVVSFKDPEDPSILITHRVQSMVVHDDVVSIVTKGDANTGVERWSVSADGTLGKVEYHVWHFGYLLFWIRGRLGRIVLVVVPALLLGAYELVRIWKPKPGAQSAEPDTTDEGNVSDEGDDITESESHEAPA
jgi:signal peptidase I